MQEKPPAKSDDRKERLAAELRANLRKRKAQAKAREPSEESSGTED